MKNPTSNVHVGTSHDERQAKMQPPKMQPSFQLRPLTRAISRILLPASMVFGASAVLAAPQNGQIQEGTGSITHGPQTTINQQSNSIVINWDSFNIDANELVTFIQPSASAAALNRILDQDPSHIFGSIEANGRVFLMNTNGVIFGKGSRVHVGSLAATGFDISNQDFIKGNIKGNYNFKAPPNSKEGGAIINYGTLEAATGGNIALAGGTVRNEGVIVAKYGLVSLLSGGRPILDFEGDGLLNFATTLDGDVTQKPDNIINPDTGEKIPNDDAIANTGKITADGGQILLHGRTARDVFTNVINNTGVIRAAGIENNSGHIRLIGGHIRLIGMGGTTVNSGTLTATGKMGRGLIQVLGDEVELASGAKLDASHSTGGGIILVGGSPYGQDSELPHATNTRVAENVVIRADATDTGEGGGIVVWANNTLQMYIDKEAGGKLSARGGPNGGDGGIIEVSGGNLDIKSGWGSSVDVGAPQGKGGKFLIDPTNITIQDTTASDGSLTNPTVDMTTILTTDITTFLGSNAILEIQTSPSDTGSITVANGFAIPAGKTLTLNAGGDLSISGALSGAGIFIGKFGQNNSGATLTINTAVTANGATPTFTGGTGNDTFTIGASAAQTGTLDGGAGNDTFNMGAKLTGNIVGGTGTDTLVGIGSGNTFAITGTSGVGTATEIVSAGFTGIENLTGNSGVDTFTIGVAHAGDLKGGGGGDDTFTMNAKLTGTIDGGVGTNTLVGIASGNTFVITGASGAGTATEIVSGGFTNIAHLTGNSGVDTFTINVANHVGNLDGAGGDDTFNINAKMAASSITGGAGTDTLVGISTGTTFTVTGTSGNGTAPELVQIGGFTGIENLTGNSGNDTFTLSAAHTGNLDGGGGDDTFNMNNVLTGTVVGGSGSDTLIGRAASNAFVVTAPDAGTVEVVSGGFTQIENLTGGALEDTFTVRSTLSGNVDGAVNNTTDTLTIYEPGGSVAGTVINVRLPIIRIIASSSGEQPFLNTTHEVISAIIPPMEPPPLPDMSGGVSVASVGVGGIGVGGIGVGGVGVSGVGAAGVGGVGVGGVGTTGVGATGVGGVGVGGVGTTGVGATGVGGVGSSGVGSSGVGSSGVGSSGVGSSGVGSSGVGSSGVGSSGVGSSGVGSSGVGSTGVGSSGVGSSGVGSSGVGATGVGGAGGVGASKAGGTKGVGASKAGGTKGVGADKAGTDSGTGTSGVDAKDGGKKKGKSNKEGSKGVKVE